MRKKNWPPRNARLPARQDSEDNRNLAFNYSLKYLSFRARSTKEIKDYLLKKNFIEQTIGAVIIKLNELKFLNDEEFGRQWIESRQKYKGKSKFILKSELRMKGLDNDIIEPLLNEARDDFETAHIAFEKKKKTLSRFTPEEFKKKMSGFLQRKGYSWSIISKLLKEN